MASGQDLIVARGNPGYEQALSEAATLTAAQARLVALSAGFREWLSAVNRFTLSRIGEQATESLGMPFPSPVTQAVRDRAGFAGGVATKKSSRWSLAVAEELSATEPYDIGVRLVCIKSSGFDEAKRISLPLDLTITSYTYRAVHERPDKITVEVGERQLPKSSYFDAEEAQQLLVVAAKFIEIVGSGHAAELAASSQALSNRRGIRRLIRGS